MKIYLNDRRQAKPNSIRFDRAVTWTGIMGMKRIVTLIFASCLFFQIQAQETKPQFLKEPANWEFERFPLPPGFAPHFGYKGVEELRFAPGMFKKDTVDYFTYAFVAQLDSVTSFSASQLQDYLYVYFKGLCSSTALNRKLIIDTSKITAVVSSKSRKTNGGVIYDCTLNVFGVFADGAPVRLNAEVKVMTDQQAQKTYLVFITSPLEKANAVWKELYAIQNRFVIPE